MKRWEAFRGGGLYCRRRFHRRCSYRHDFYVFSLFWRTAGQRYEIISWSLSASDVATDSCSVLLPRANQKPIWNRVRGEQIDVVMNVFTGSEFPSRKLWCVETMTRSNMPISFGQGRTLGDDDAVARSLKTVHGAGRAGDMRF